MSAATLGGIASAAIAAACFDGGLAIQALDARAVPQEHGLHPRLLMRLMRRRRWLAATALAFAGWPFPPLALGLAPRALAPRALVRPTLALGLVLLLYLGHRILGERVGAAEMVAVGGIVGAVAALAWAAPPETSHHAGAARIAIGLAPLAVLAVAPLALPRLGVRVPPGLLPFASGAAYAFTGVTSKLVVDDLRTHVVTGVLLWVPLTAAPGLAGLLLEMSSLQRLPATHVGPNVFVVQVCVPVLLAPLVSGESWANTPLSGGVILMAVAATAASAIVLTRSPAVAAFADAAAGD